MIDRMALKAALDKGSPLLGGFQRWIVELEEEGHTPETWLAGDEPETELPDDETHDARPGRTFLIVPSTRTNDRLARDVARDVTAALPAGRRVVLDLTSTFPGRHGWSVRRIVTGLESSTQAEIAAKVVEWMTFEPQVIEGRLAEMSTPERPVAWFYNVLERIVERGNDLVICAPAPTVGKDDLVLGLAALPHATVMGCADSFGAMTDDEIETLRALAASAGGEFYALAHDVEGADDGEPEVHGGIDMYRTDFSNRYQTSVGFALLRERLNLRSLPLPGGLDYDVEREIVDCFASEGIDLPYIPDDMAEEIVRFTGTTFATSNWAVSAEDAYMFRGAVSSVLGDWQPRLAVTLGGHGSNSYAWTYVLVGHGIAIVGQVHRGLAYPSPQTTEDDWASLMDGAQRLHWAAQNLEIPADRMLLVEWSALRDQSRWRLLGKFEGGADGWAEVDVRDFGHDRAGGVFESAIDEGLRRLATP